MDLSTYSKYRPRIKMVTKIEDRVITWILNRYISKITGMRRVISISKIKKIIVMRKNWILNGRRLKDRGSNPHSKGEDFSNLLLDFFDKIKFNNKSTGGIIIIINKEVMKIVNITL